VRGCPGLRCAGSCLWFGGEHLGSGICNQVWSFVCVCVYVLVVLSCVVVEE
jgi:hypothetical protein